MARPSILTILRNYLYCAPLVGVVTVVVGSLSLIVSLFSSTGRTQHKLARVWSRMMLWIVGVRVHVEGLEKIAPGGSYVFIANHRSYYDVPVILPYISVQFRFLADKTIYRIPFIGYHLHRAGHLMVDGDNARESLKNMAAAARIIQKRGISILLFPEGSRTSGEMLPFKDGAAYIAIKAGVPIVPIGLQGVGQIMPLGSSITHPGDVWIRIGDPIPTLEFPLSDRTRLSRELQQIVAALEEGQATSTVAA